MEKNLRNKIKLSPESPGVYLFSDKVGHVIYVGKAKNLKNRLNSYMATDLGVKTAQMLNFARNLEMIEVANEFEALLLEARLVKKYDPKYNIQLKDDKSPVYIIITKEKFPRVLLARKTQLLVYKPKATFGPFTSAMTARRILKRIRGVFPFSQHKIGKKACIYSQIGLCDPCPNSITRETDRKIYLKNISLVVKTLSGGPTKVKRELEAEMKAYSKKEDFESAQRILTQISEMKFLTRSFEGAEGYISNPNLLIDTRETELNDLADKLSGFIKIGFLTRIECYDVAHLAGTFPTASMVTFIDGTAQKAYYRHFGVKTELKGDTDRLREVFLRRIKHFSDWGVPDLIIVDGGKPQLSAAKSTLGENFPVVGLAKRFETLVFVKDGQFAELRLPASAARNLVQRLRDEAHRFARRYHHKLVAKALTKKVS